MPYMVKIAQLLIRKYRYFAIRAAVSEIQLIFTLNGNISHHYLTEYPIGLKLCSATPGCPRIFFGKVGQSSFLCEI